MTTLIGLAVGLLVAGVVRIYAGNRFATSVPVINLTLAGVSLLVWIIARSDAAVALPIAMGIVLATVILRMRTVARDMSRKQGVFFGAWMLMLASFAVSGLVRG